MASTQIRRIGNYLEVDEQGCLQSRAHISNIKEPWLAATQALVGLYLDKWGDDIHSVYARGSLAKNVAVEGISDIDSFAVLNPGKVQELSYDDFGAWATEVEGRIRCAFPFVAGVELGLETWGGVQDRANVYTFIIKTEATCVFGEDLANGIEPYELSPDVAFQTKYFRHHLEQFLSDYPDESEQGKPEFVVWIVRRFLRLGMELVMVEEQRYTRDLYLCYESFVKHYPEQDAEMYRALELAVNPEIGQAVEEFLRRFGAWLTREAERKLVAWGYAKDSEDTWVRPL